MSKESAKDYATKQLMAELKNSFDAVNYSVEEGASMKEIRDKLTYTLTLIEEVQKFIVSRNENLQPSVSFKTHGKELKTTIEMLDELKFLASSALKSSRTGDVISYMDTSISIISQTAGKFYMRSPRLRRK